MGELLLYQCARRICQTRKLGAFNLDNLWNDPNFAREPLCNEGFLQSHLGKDEDSGNMYKGNIGATPYKSVWEKPPFPRHPRQGGSR